MIQEIRPTSSADSVAWDLSDLYRAVDDPSTNHELDSARKPAQAFESGYRGRIHREDGPDPATLQRAAAELESLSEQMDKPVVYASLLHAAKTDDPPRGALLARAR